MKPTALAAITFPGVLGLMVALGGCEPERPASTVRTAPKTPTHRPVRTAAVPIPATQPVAFQQRNSGISLFGEISDVDRVPFAGQAASGIQQHTFTRVGGDFDPAVDPTGRLLVFASTRHSTHPDIYIKTIGGSAVTQITDDPASDVQPDISSDGKWIAFASNRSGNWDIWISSIDGQTTQQLTKSPQAEVRPSWASDGQRLVYCAMNVRTGQWELWLADMRQPGTQKIIGNGLFPRWSPKEDVILYQRARSRGNRWFSVWTLRLIDGQPRYPTEVASSADQALISPCWMPDGKRIVYCSIRSVTTPTADPRAQTTRSDIWITDADGMGKIRLTKGGSVNYSPVCGRDGRVYFVSNRSGCENIWSAIPSGPPEPMADARPGKETRTKVRQASDAK